MVSSSFSVRVNTGENRYEYLTMAMHAADALTSAIERFGVCAVSVSRPSAGQGLASNAA
jgi:hypothetical protein